MSLLFVFDIIFADSALTACDSAKLEEIQAPSTGSATIDCDLDLTAEDIIRKRIVLSGSLSSGVTINCNGGALAGGVSIRSRSYLEAGERKWEPVENVEIKNCQVNNELHLFGMARTGEGTEFDGINPFRISSKKPGHTQRARANAPSNITLKNLTIINTWLYIAPGVTRVRLVNSLLTGITPRGAIYLDAESAYSVIANNVIETRTRPDRIVNYLNWLGLPPGIQVISIDGSSHNTIKNNNITATHDAIHFYRNCGEGGVIRHTTPSHNTIVGNDFLGKRPSIVLGSRDGSGWFPVLNNIPCHQDEGHAVLGSALSNGDHAAQNTITDNRFHTLWGVTLDDLIRSKNWEENSPNHIKSNVVIAGSAND